MGCKGSKPKDPKEPKNVAKGSKKEQQNKGSNVAQNQGEEIKVNNKRAQNAVLSPVKEEREEIEIESAIKRKAQDHNGKKKHHGHDKIKRAEFNSSSLESSLDSKDKYSVEESDEVDEHYEESNHS